MTVPLYVTLGTISTILYCIVCSICATTTKLIYQTELALYSHILARCGTFSIYFINVKQLYSSFDFWIHVST